MISLQVALLIAGVIVFGIVLAVSYDKTRRRKAQRNVETEDEAQEPSLIVRNKREFDDVDEDDALFQETSRAPEPAPAVNVEKRMKPEFLDEDDSGQPQGAPKEDWEVELEDAENVANTPIEGSPQVDQAQEDDPIQLEFVVRIPGTNVVNRDQALGIFRQHEFELNKRRRIFGLSHPARMWCDLEKQPETARFTEIGMTLQLADRDGPTDEGEINQFSQMALKMAEAFERRLQFSRELDSAIEHAHRLGELIKKYDALAILNVAARDSGFPLADVDRTARVLGLTRNEKNVYVKYQGNRIRYRMVGLDPPDSGRTVHPTRRSTHGLTLFMNIPRTPAPAEVFLEMIEDAREICKQLDGKLVDQNQRGMTQKGLKQIGQEIRQISGEMEKDGIVPGSEHALKLF